MTQFEQLVQLHAELANLERSTHIDTPVLYNGARAAIERDIKEVVNSRFYPQSA